MNRNNLYRRFWLASVTVLCTTLMVLSGCQTDDEGGSRHFNYYGGKGDSAPEEKPAPKPEEPRKPAPSGSCVAFPTGDRATSVICIERRAPSEVVVGQPFDYDIIVTNLTNLDLSNVVVKEQTAQNFKFDSSVPPTTSAAGNTLTWNLANFKPHEVKTIKVKGSATGTGALTHCLSVTYDQAACSTISVVEPKLALTAVAPATVLICDPINIKYTVTNNGTGAATNVVVKSELPKGLTTADGKSTVELNAGTLAAGQSKSFDVLTKSANAGDVATSATATSGALKAEASTKTNVRQSAITLAAKGPEQVLLGREVCHEYTLTNSSDVDATNVNLDVTVTGGSIASASDAGKVVGNKVSWAVGTLAAKATKTVKVCSKGSAIGSISSAGNATGTCVKAADAKAATNIKGIPAVLLEVVDENDPIEVGGNEVYTITVTNQGSATDTNIKIEVTLEDSMTFVSATGATAGTAAGTKVTMAPLASLNVGAKATWKVIVKAAKEGDVRFKVVMTTDQLTRTVEETESTNFFK